MSRQEGQREMQTPRSGGSPMRDSIARPRDHDLSRRQILNLLSLQAAPGQYFLKPIHETMGRMPEISASHISPFAKSSYGFIVYDEFRDLPFFTVLQKSHKVNYFAGRHQGRKPKGGKKKSPKLEAKLVTLEPRLTTA